MAPWQNLTGDHKGTGLGWYTGRDSPNTRRLVADFGGFEYDSDYYGEDLPFWMNVRKVRRQRGATAHRALHAGLQRHAFCAAPGLFSHADPFFQYLKDTFDALYAEGDPDIEKGDNAPKMMSIGMHCRLLGPGPGASPRCNVFWTTFKVARPCVGGPPGGHRPPLDKPPTPTKADPMSAPTPSTRINTSPPDEAAKMLDGLYEHSPWIVQARP
jgi:hypothetical protein